MSIFNLRVAPTHRDRNGLPVGRPVPGPPRPIPVSGCLSRSANRNRCGNPPRISSSRRFMTARVPAGMPSCTGCERDCDASRGRRATAPWDRSAAEYKFTLRSLARLTSRLASGLILFHDADCCSFCVPLSRHPRDFRASCSSGTGRRHWRCGARCDLDRRDAFVERVEDRVLEPLPRELGEEPLDGVHPGSRGRSEVKRPIGVVLQPFADLGRLVGGDVVEHHVHGVPGLIPSETRSRRRGIPSSGDARPSGR